MPDSNPADAATGLPEDPVAEAKRLLAKRTPGEWRLGADRILGKVLYAALAPPEIIVAEGRREDMELIAAAPRLLAALCERLDAAERLIEYGAAHFGECHRSEDEQRHGSPCRWVRDAVAYIEATE